MPRPKREVPTPRVLTVRLTEDDYLWLKAAAAVTRKSMNELVVGAVAYARKHDGVEPTAAEEIRQIVARWAADREAEKTNVYAG